MTRTECSWVTADGGERCEECGRELVEGEDMLITSTGVRCCDCCG